MQTTESKKEGIQMTIDYFDDLLRNGSAKLEPFVRLFTAAGDSWDVITRGYPELSREDIQAALLYARAVLENNEVMEDHA